jgi:5,6-dimethylbenzimidazole synthase
MIEFGERERAAVYEVIQRRRDIRHFRAGEPVDAAVLRRILEAGHRAPSVGYSQPWDFVLVRDRARRARIRESFLRCREREAAGYSPERRQKYEAYRLEGILEADLNLCITVDQRPRTEPVLGTVVQPQALLGSVYCAVENVWLAARAEGIGIGWVSIVEPEVLKHELGLPDGVEPAAYLCVGHPVEFRDKPMLEETGWHARRPLDEAIHEEQF